MTSETRPTEPGWWWASYKEEPPEAVRVVDNGRGLQVQNIDFEGTVPFEDFIWLRPVLSMEEEDQLRADVARMPVTKDGKRVMPGDAVYDEHLNVYRVQGRTALPADWSLPELLVVDCFSTQEAAQESINNPLQENPQ